MTADAQLDVRSKPPARRHTLILDTHHALAPGAGFELVNDPKPLFYQLDADFKGQFTWACSRGLRSGGCASGGPPRPDPSPTERARGGELSGIQ